MNYLAQKSRFIILGNQGIDADRFNNQGHFPHLLSLIRHIMKNPGLTKLPTLFTDLQLVVHLKQKREALASLSVSKLLSSGRPDFPKPLARTFYHQIAGHFQIQYL